MKLSEAVKSLMERGGTHEQILGLILASEAPEREREEKRREKARLRKQAQRARSSPNVTRDMRDNEGQAGTDGDTGGTRVGARAEPKITNSSSTHSEIKEEEKQDSASALPQRGKHLLPDDFVPKPSTFAKALSEWGFDRSRVLERVEAMREWSRGKGEKRLDWDLVLLGFLRRDAQRATGPPGRPTNGHGKPTFADIMRATSDVIAEEENQSNAPPLELKALSH